MARKYLLKADPVDTRDFLFSPKTKELPKRIDLRDKMPPVVDQGRLGSCTSNAIVSGLREYLLLQEGKDIRLSRLYHYWHERALEGTINEDSGATLRDGMKVLKKFGVCPEEDFPYEIERFTEQPSEQAEKDAAQFKISEYHRVPTLNKLKAALADGLPVAIGIVVFESFESEEVAQTGIVPMPKWYEQELGGHAMLAVGYDDEKGHVIVRNSWGPDWGDGGYCYLPYDYFRHRIVFDMWTGH